MNDIRFHHGSSEWCFKGPDGKPYQYFNEVECHRLRQQYAADPSLFKSWPYIWHTTERGEFLAIKIGRKYGRIVTKCVRCTRCGGIGRAIEFELQSGFLGGTPGDWRKHNRVEKEVRAKVCTKCWHKWITQRLMIIKEHPPFRACQGMEWDTRGGRDGHDAMRYLFNEDKILCNKMRTFLKLGDDENSTLPPHRGEEGNMKQTFELRFAYEGYRDFEYTLKNTPDGVSGFVRITLVNAPALEEGVKPLAYGEICFHTPDGEDVLRRDFQLDREQAERIIGKELREMEAPHENARQAH